MTNRRSRTSMTRRALSAAICYVLALQALFAAFGAALAAGQANSEFTSIICHGAGSTTPAQRDADQPRNLPCVLCAAAAAGGAVLPASMPVVAPALVAATVSADCEAAAIVPSPNPRAGLSRAPPSFG